MIQLDNIYLHITKCEKKTDRKGNVFLKCKGFTKGLEGAAEKKIIEHIGKEYKKIISGANYLSTINVYGQEEQLDLLLTKFQKAMDEINAYNDSISGLTKQQRHEQIKILKPRVFKFFPKGIMFLRTYLVTGMLMTCVYIFDFEFCDKKPRGRINKTVKAIENPTKRKVGRPKQTEEQRLKNKEKRLKEKEKRAKKVRPDGVITQKVKKTTHAERFETMQSEKRKAKEEQNKIKEIEKQTKEKSSKIVLPKSDFISEIDMLEQLVQETQNTTEIESLDADLENNSNED